MGHAFTGVAGRSPSGQQKASVRWQTAWWALIEPHKRVSVGLRSAMRLRMLARSPAEDRVFIAVISRED
jgi:hypothetical protein